MRGRILKVPMIQDLATGALKSSSSGDVSRDGCRWSDRGSYSVGFPGQCEASRLQQCERHESVAPVQDGTERCATMRDAGSCCSNAEVREGALVSDRGSFSISGCL